MYVLAIATDPFEEVSQKRNIRTKVSALKFLHSLHEGIVTFGLFPDELETEIGQNRPFVLIFS